MRVRWTSARGSSLPPAGQPARAERVGLAKRIIPCLDVDGGRVVKGVRFVEIRDAGDPVEVAQRYDEQKADEITFLDITASSSARNTMVEVVRRVAAEVFIPLTVGGGIREVADIHRLLHAGADKVPSHCGGDPAGIGSRGEPSLRRSVHRGGNRRQACGSALASVHPRRAHTYGPGCGRLGPAHGGPRCWRNTADQHGP